MTKTKGIHPNPNNFFRVRPCAFRYCFLRQSARLCEKPPKTPHKCRAFRGFDGLSDGVKIHMPRYRSNLFIPSRFCSNDEWT